MAIEHEVKFLGIDHEKARKRLRALSASLVTPRRLMKRRTFDYPDRRLNLIKSWIRLRDEGTQVTLTHKKLRGQTATADEVSIVVDGFERATLFLTSIGLELKSCQENWREVWSYGDALISLDTWPWIPDLLELEGPNEDCLRRVAEVLVFYWADATLGPVGVAYSRYYCVSEEDVNEVKHIAFDLGPPWNRTSAFA